MQRTIHVSSSPRHSILVEWGKLEKCIRKDVECGWRMWWKGIGKNADMFHAWYPHKRQRIGLRRVHHVEMMLRILGGAQMDPGERENRKHPRGFRMRIYCSVKWCEKTIIHGEEGSYTSNRAFRTENGFKRNPTATRVVAPANRFPWEVRDGRTETFSPDPALRTWTKYGDCARNVRIWVRLVIYSATPGTFLSKKKWASCYKTSYRCIYLIREGDVPLQSPWIPSATITPRAVPSITEEWDLGIGTIVGVRKAGVEKHATAMWQGVLTLEALVSHLLVAYGFWEGQLAFNTSAKGIYIWQRKSTNRVGGIWLLPTLTMHL